MHNGHGREANERDEAAQRLGRLTSKPILVTGAAGFIGYHLAQRLLDQGFAVAGLDNMNDYYDPSLKEARLELLSRSDSFSFFKIDLADSDAMSKLFDSIGSEVVVNLAAQAGVRYSIENPHVYVESNVTGFVNLLEACRYSKAKHLVYASSSSVYGANKKLPFAVEDNVDHPISLYAATKRANELMAHTYSHLFSLPTTGLRFFTVYGPWGRPDMALFKFTKAILEGRPIDVYNNGEMKRDFTYVDDIVEGIVRVASLPPQTGDCEASEAPYRLYNIGNNQPVMLMEFIRAIEHHIGKEAKMNLLPLQPGDVPDTFADVTGLMKDYGFKPSTSVIDGIGKFVEWYREYYSA